MDALLAAQTAQSNFSIALVISNVEGAPALEKARSAGVVTATLPSRGISRSAHEKEVLGQIVLHNIDIICLAGYMRVLTADFVSSFARPILNIHPSLLPAFPGMRAQRQALDAGVKWTGATVHFVDASLDGGPILLQAPVPVMVDDTEDTLAARILQTEHVLYPRALEIVSADAYEVLGKRVRILSPDSENLAH